MSVIYVLPTDKPTEENCTCTDECLGYLTKTCKGIEEETKQDALNHFLSTSNVFVKDSNKWDFLKEEPKQETIEEYFLGKMKEVLLFKNDAQAIRFMEKYYQAKKEQKRSYSEDEVLHILDTFWDRLDVWYNEGVDENFSLREWFNDCELKKK